MFWRSSIALKPAVWTNAKPTLPLKLLRIKDRGQSRKGPGSGVCVLDKQQMSFRSDLPPVDRFEKRLLLGRHCRIFLVIAGPILDTRFGHPVRRHVIRGNIQSAADVAHSGTKGRLAVFGQEPVEENLCCVGMRSSVYEHRGAKPGTQISAVVFEFRHHTELEPAFFELVHDSSRTKVQRILALGHPLDLLALVSVDRPSLDADFFVKILCLLWTQHMPYPAEDSVPASRRYRILNGNFSLPFWIQQLV